MKRKFILCLLASVSLLATSCEDILDKEPTDKLSLEETFKDLDGVKTALSGAYISLLELDLYQRNIMAYPDLAGGNIRYSIQKYYDMYELYTFTQNPQETNTDLDNSTDMYTALYSTLNNVNNIIAYTPNTLYATDQQKNRVIAEAKALRALLHFDLVRLFARPYGHTAGAAHPGVVLNLKPRLITDPLPARATVAETYAAITQDLTEALELYANSSAVFSGGNANAYFNSNSMKALLAKVYLYQGDWQQAYRYADEVIQSGRYRLLDSQAYIDSWSSKATVPETILELVLENDFSGTSLGNYYAPGSKEQMFAATTDLLDLYSPTDIRGRESLFVAESKHESTYHFTRKYGQGGVYSTSIKVLRLAELYLIRAEAAAELGNLAQANQDLSQIILRADPDATPAAYTAKEELVEAILLERRKELAFEGNLLFDLTRRQRGVNRQDCSGTPCSLPYTDHRLVLPIPKETINVNPQLQQNEGY